MSHLSRSDAAVAAFMLETDMSSIALTLGLQSGLTPVHRKPETDNETQDGVHHTPCTTANRSDNVNPLMSTNTKRKRNRFPGLGGTHSTHSP